MTMPHEEFPRQQPAEHSGRPRPSVVAHVIPYDGIGGVESAARTVDQGRYDDIDFLRVYIASKGTAETKKHVVAGPYWSENDVRNYLFVARRLLSLKPDVLICSLWRGYIVGIVIKLIRPSTRIVSFLHFPESAHLLDYIFTRLITNVASAIWADSSATLADRIPNSKKHLGRVISFVSHRLNCVSEGGPAPTFTFWGRLAPKKGLRRSLTIFAEIIALLPEAKYTIIGPDGGEGPALRRTCVELGIEGAVRFAGPMDFSQIAREASLHSFYLCTSILEGMAMSVVEAMQLGLVPIVTAVGEIANYCEDGKNSLVIDDDASVASRVARLIGNRELYYELRRNAVNYWSSRPLYRDDVIAACRALAPRKQ